MTRGPGTYALILASHSRTRVAIGRLGTLRLEPGFYVNVADVRCRLVPATGPSILKTIEAARLLK